MYGQHSKLDSFNKDCFARAHISNYAELQNCFNNIDDKDRSNIIGANFPYTDEEISQYLKYKKLVDPNDLAEEKRRRDLEKGIKTDRESAAVSAKPVIFTKSKDFQADVLQAKVEMLSFKIEAGHLQRVMMSWLAGGA
jgi:hypothetical protein